MAKLKYKMPERMEELLDWVIALHRWDFGEPKHLCNLIEKYAIPEELRKSISKRLSSEIKPKSSANMKNSSADNLYIGYVLYTIRHIKEAERDKAAAVAENIGKEVSEVVRDINIYKNDVIMHTAKDFGISQRTADEHYKKLLDKIKDWPNL